MLRIERWETRQGAVKVAEIYNYCLGKKKSDVAIEKDKSRKISVFVLIIYLVEKQVKFGNSPVAEKSIVCFRVANLYR